MMIQTAMEKINYKTLLSLFLLSFALLSLTACSESTTSPKGVAEKFWEAVQARDMEAAKVLSTWDTVDYLKYLKIEKLHPERFEVGELMLGDTRAEVAIVLFTQKQGKSGIKVPGTTVLIKKDNVWLVDVKKTLNSVIKHSIDNVFDQLNGLMKEGIKELDSTLSESMDEVGKALEEGAQELKNELTTPFFK